MKKITILALAALAIGFASCKKDRTCTCTSTGSTSTTTKTMKKISKKDAKDYCQKTSWTNTDASGTTTGTTDCKLS